jgi:hypothetical protein
MLYISVVKFPALTSRNLVSVCCHPQNGIHIVHPLQGQTGGSCREPDLGCEEDGKNSPSHFWDCLIICASWCEAGHCCFGTSFIFWLRQTLSMHYCSLFKVPLYHSQLTVVPFSKKSRSEVQSLFQNMNDTSGVIFDLFFTTLKMFDPNLTVSHQQFAPHTHCSGACEFLWGKSLCQ